MLTRGSDKLWSAATGDAYTSCQEQNENNIPIDSATCINGIGVEVLDNNKRDNPLFKKDDSAAFTKYDWTGGFIHDGVEKGVKSFFIVLPAAGVYAFAITNVGVNLQPLATTMVTNAPKAVFPAAPTAPTAPSPAPAPAPVPAPGPSGGCFTNIWRFFQTSFGLRGGN